MNCPECSESMEVLEQGRTMIGGPIGLPAGHDHDPNCVSRIYACANGHRRKISIVNRCPVCDWVQDRACFCHPDPKLDRWPE